MSVYLETNKTKSSIFLVNFFWRILITKAIGCETVCGLFPLDLIKEI